MPVSIKQQIPLYGILIAFFAGMFLPSPFFNTIFKSSEKTTPQEPAVKETSCDVTRIRLGGYKYIKPILFANTNCESTRLSPLKNGVHQLITAFKTSGDVSSASIYLRDLGNSEWIALNDKETYHPGSLYKVLILIAYLRKAEDAPELLEKELVYKLPEGTTLPPQNYISESIELGHTYTIRTLLKYLISNSDNNAQWLLMQHLDIKEIEQIFSDFGFGIPLPGEDSQMNKITAKDYSIFIRTLFNATYISTKYSEFALSLMGDCRFTDGFIKGLPTGTTVAHKFGEWDDTSNFELHESGIIYLKDKAYLLTVMTRGKQRDKLPNAIAAITKSVYGNLTGN